MSTTQFYLITLLVNKKNCINHLQIYWSTRPLVMVH